jgi:hypothetical protein
VWGAHHTLGLECVCVVRDLRGNEKKRKKSKRKS